MAKISHTSGVVCVIVPGACHVGRSLARRDHKRKVKIPKIKYGAPRIFGIYVMINFEKFQRDGRQKRCPKKEVKNMSSQFTRREFLERLEELHDQHVKALEEVVQQGNDELRDAASTLEKATESWAEHFPALERAAGKFADGQIQLGKSLEKASENICDGIILGAVLFLCAGVISAVQKAINVIYKKIIALTLVGAACDRCPYVTFRYLVSLLSFCGYPREEAREIVEDLIMLGALKRYRVGKIQALRLDRDSDFIQALVEAAETMQKKEDV